MSHQVDLAPAFPLLPVTATWCPPITLYYISLSGRVAWQRKQSWTIMGDRHPDPKDLVSDPLYTAVRCQMNFLEYVPMAMTLASVAELNGASKKYLNWALTFLFTIRVAHVEMGLLAPSRRSWGRHVGYWGSLAWLAGGGAWGAGLSRKYWGWWRYRWLTYEE